MIQIGLRRSIRFAKGPGLIFLIPIVDRMVRMDLRVVTIDVARQEVMTRDNVPMTVDAVVYFRVIDPAAAVVRVENYLKATSLISQTTLRSVLGQAELDELLTQRDKINLRLQEIIDRQTEPWGIKVTAVEVRDVVLPDRLDDWLSESGLTGIITAKSQGDDPFVGEGHGFMQFMADCVVALKLRVVDQIALRYVQVIKYRGSSFAENEAPLVIGASGMEVADISATTVAPAASQARVSSGVERLDAMLGSGYFRGSSVLITGSAGTGKSILAGAFAEAACLRKERNVLRQL